jgi:hypothetical protein
MTRSLKRTLGISTLLGALACSLVVDTDEIDEGCPTGTKLCEGSCVEIDDPTYGCGDEGCEPCETDGDGNALNDRIVPACKAGTCTVGRCTDGYGCDRCLRNLLSDNQNCGSCNHICRGGRTCSAGECLPAEGRDGAAGAAN